MKKHELSEQELEQIAGGAQTQGGQSGATFAEYEGGSGSGSGGGGGSHPPVRDVQDVK